MRWYCPTQNPYYVINLSLVRSIELTDKDENGNRDLFIRYGGIKELIVFSYPEEEALKRWHEITKSIL